MTIEISQLKKVPLFEALLPDQLKLIQSIVEEQSFKPSTKLCADGDVADRLYFIVEGRVRISAEFTPADIVATLELIDTGLLELDGLISHARPAAQAADAYPQAFTDPDCRKMVLDWRAI